ncbi:MAG: polysaccharide export protein [Enterovirga sp.]|jgi:polysaccharide export outer membrane protein|nr:polysaccharide export protein [Enterovirga sp.]
MSSAAQTIGRLTSRLIGLALWSVAAAGCTSLIVPKDGPTGLEVTQNAEITLADGGRLSYALVKLTPLVVSTMQTERQPNVQFSRLAREESSADVRIGPADTINLTIFEASAGGLFIPTDAGSRPGNFVSVPPQEVDRNGNISVPYAGDIRALGRTPGEVGKEIESRLRQRAIEPQAVVTIAERASFAVSVLGDVFQPTTIALKPGGIRVLSAIARAGGSRFPAYETMVTLQRRGRTEQAALSAIARDPSQNIQLAPEDVVYVSQEPRAFLAFGATPDPGALGGQNSRRFSFDRENMTLAEGLAKMGGLLTSRADPKAVFLFRYTPREILQRAGVNLKALPGAQVPTVYTIDLSQAEGFFIADNFYLKNRDIMFVSDTPSVDLLKFFDIVNGVTGAARGATGAATEIRALR